MSIRSTADCFDWRSRAAPIRPFSAPTTRPGSSKDIRSRWGVNFSIIFRPGSGISGPALTYPLSLRPAAPRSARIPRWQAVASFRQAFLEVLSIVTAFTIAHSITLSLAVLGFITLPSRLIESTIAASVVVAALNNLYPLIAKRLWVVAFVFGLVHGLGFANVLTDLALPKPALAVSLVSFNLGVEAGQLAIVAAFLPLAYLSRRSWLYPRLVLGAGSLSIVAVASVWLLERSLDISIFS
jgi:hypothetical protein